jgi:hypothetical protein
VRCEDVDSDYLFANFCSPLPFIRGPAREILRRSPPVSPSNKIRWDGQTYRRVLMLNGKPCEVALPVRAAVQRPVMALVSPQPPAANKCENMSNIFRHYPLGFTQIYLDLFPADAGQIQRSKLHFGDDGALNVFSVAPGYSAD